MKIRCLTFLILFCYQFTAHAADLVEVYQQALFSDPIYQQAISQRLATRQGVPISLSALLPAINVTANPAIKRSGYSGAQTSGVAIFPKNNTLRSYELALTATQTVFNYAQYANLTSALATARGADATLNAALQDLMTRVANAYFAVLRDEDNLAFTEASKYAYAEQLDQVKQQFNVGLKTVTEVYTAQASYDSATASFIAAQTTLSNDRENLRVITGKYYPRLAHLSERFPLIRPQPANIETWVSRAQMQNWQIRASQYAVDSARQTVKQQFGGHLPTVNMQAQVDRIYNNNINGYRNIDERSGPSTETDRQIMLNINVPLFEGGGVVAETNQAVYQFNIAQQQLEQTLRNTINTTRQSYLGILAGVSQITADKQAIKSSKSSLDGMEASYQVGTETLVNVLNQQEKVYQAQTQYATDEFNFINNIFLLKQAAGTLSFDDLRAINAWLVDDERGTIHRQHFRYGGEPRRFVPSPRPSPARHSHRTSQVKQRRERETSKLAHHHKSKQLRHASLRHLKTPA